MMTYSRRVSRPALRPWAVLTVAAAVLALTSCAQPTDDEWTPPSWPEAEIVATEIPAPLDGASLPDLQPQRLRNDTVGIQARYTELAGPSEVGSAVTAIVRAAIADREVASGHAYAPEVFETTAALGDRACVSGSTTRSAQEILIDPALGPAGGHGTAVVCDIVAAVGVYFGERVRVVTGNDAGISRDDTSVIYSNSQTGETTSSAGLWGAEAATHLWGDVVDVVRREYASLSLREVQPPSAEDLAVMNAALDSTLIAPDGTLVVSVPAGFTAPELQELGVKATTEPMAVGVAPAASAHLTSPFGTDIVQNAASRTAFAPPTPQPRGQQNVDCSLFACLSLTYDDGSSDMTAGILDEAAERDAAVTFFVMGGKVASYADVMRRALSEGHLVENHTWNHPSLPTLTPEQVRAQIHDTNQAIADAIGVRPTVFRPPYGELNGMVMTEAGMAAILWDIDTEDWRGIDDDELIDRVLTQSRPGSIVLQHDIQSNTARTAGAIYDGLLDRGFVLVNIQQLFGGQLPAEGVWRSGR